MGRFTPTCVGNTLSPAGVRRETTVHPHVRGEYVAAYLLNCHKSGSPPRAWGIRRGARSAPVLSRFTPTCVGNTPRLV